MPFNHDEDAEAPAVAALTSLSGSSQESSGEYISEDDHHIHRLDRSGALAQVAGSQSMLSQELSILGAAATTKEEEEAIGGLSQMSDIALSQESAASGGSDFDSQRVARKYGLLSQDPFAIPARSLAEQPVAQRSYGDPASPGAGIQKALPDSQGSCGGEGANFGSLLDAVSFVQSQEEFQLTQESQELENSDSEENVDKSPQVSPRKRQTRPPSSRIKTKSRKMVDRDSSSLDELVKKSTKKNAQPSPKKNVNQGPLQTKKKAIFKNEPPPPAEDPTTLKKAAAKQPKTNKAQPLEPKKRKRKDESEQIKLQRQAQRAAALAQRTINDADLAKRLLLSMALTRENPRSAPDTLPGPGFALPEGFFWAHYPPLEKVLKDNMAEYYELSVTRCQSAQQQSFNNTLVKLVRKESDSLGWSFAPIFTDKSLRDRIRCYYKTHIQNAKKRLRTMIKNPTKRANARHLCAHLDMIESNVSTNGECKDSACTLEPSSPASKTDKSEDWGASMAGDPRFLPQIKDLSQQEASMTPKAGPLPYKPPPLDKNKGMAIDKDNSASSKAVLQETNQLSWSDSHGTTFPPPLSSAGSTQPTDSAAASLVATATSVTGLAPTPSLSDPATGATAAVAVSAEAKQVVV